MESTIIGNACLIGLILVLMAVSYWRAKRDIIKKEN